MMITPSPRRQSCATWLRPITRHSRPISVQPPARVERCTVTYSRITVSAPTRTPESVPSLYLRSWGAPPTTLPWPTFTRGPSATRPSSTAWWPISTPLSSVTSGPITLKAPTRTPASSRARGSMIAEGWIASLTALALALETAAERLHHALQRTHALQQIGQARLRGEDPLGFQNRPRGSSEVAAAGVEVGWHSALRGDQRPVADGHVVRDTHLARQHPPRGPGARAPPAAPPRPAARPRLDHHQRAHGRRRVDARVRGHDGARVHAGNEGRGRVEEQQQIDHRLLGRGHAQHGRRQAADAGGGDEGAGPRGLGGQMVAGVGEEGHVVRPRALPRRDAPHHPRGVTLEGGAQRLRELAESELGSADHRRYFFLPPASRS